MNKEETCTQTLSASRFHLLSALFVLIYLVEVISNADECQKQETNASGLCYQLPRS